MEKNNSSELITQVDTLSPKPEKFDVKKKRGRPKKIKTIEPEAPETIVQENTVIVEPAEPEKKEIEEPPNILKGLNEEKKKLEAQISSETDENVKKELLKQKRGLCLEILQTAGIGTGKNIEEEIKQEEQRQLGISIAASGFKSMENYEKTMRDRYFNEIILASNLSGEQRKALAKDGKLAINKHVILSKEEVAACIRMGIDVLKTKKAVFSKKIKTVIKNEKYEDNDLDSFKKSIEASQEMAAINEEARQKIEQRKNEIIDKGITDFVLNKKVLEITDPLEEKESVEFSENPEEARSLKIETPEDQLKNLESLRTSWDQANIISTALKENKKVTLPDGEVLDPNNEENRKLLEDAKNSLSDEIINIAGKISGRNLRKEAAAAVNYDLEQKDPEKQNEFRDWLTKEVQKIYENSMEELKKVAQVSEKKITLEDLRPPKKIQEEIEKKYPFNSTF